MEAFSALLTICVGNSPVPGEFPAQRLVTRSFDVFFDLCLNKRLSKQSWGWWFETLSRPIWRHCHVAHRCLGSELLRNFYVKINKYWHLLGWKHRHQPNRRHARKFLLHDDVIKWKHFRVTGPLCGKFTNFFDLRLHKRLSKQPSRRWFETSSRSLSQHCNDMKPVTWWLIN